MENNNPRRDGRRKPQTKKVTNETTTEAGSPVMFVTIEEHTKMIDEKTSQLISLENGLRGSEQTIANFENTVRDLKAANQKLKLSLSNETIVAAGYLNKLSKIPNWIKKLFNAA
jgi:CRISPR/Cas system CMR-associated protein Cmr5 small subunit